MLIGLAQIRSSADKVANFALVEDAVEKAVEQGAQLVVFPEATMQAFGTGRLDTQAEEPGDAFIAGIEELADRYGVAIIAGVFSPADEYEAQGKTIRRVTNTLVIARPNSENLYYDKIHTYDAFGYKESEYVKPGSELVTFNYAGITFGLATCYDLRFPEQFKTLAAAPYNAQAIIVPASWGAGERKLNQWQILAAARALDSVSVVIAVGQAQPSRRTKAVDEESPTGIGHSMIVGPFGDKIIELGTAPETAVISVDIAGEVATAREALPVLDYPDNENTINI